MSAGIELENQQRVVNETQAYLLAAGTIFLWTLGVIIAKAVRDDIPLIGLSFWRWVAAAAMLLPLVRKELIEKFSIIREHSRLLAFQGALLVGSSTLLFYSVNYTSAINATLVNAVQPVATSLIAWIILHDRLNFKQIIGVILAAVGVIFMITKASWEILRSLDFNKGDMLLVIAIFGYGWYSVNIRKLPAGLGIFAALAVTLFIGCLFLLPFYLAETYYVGPFPLSYSSVGTVLAIALLVSMLAMGMWSKSNHIIGPSRAAVFVTLMPLYGAILATAFLGELLYAYHITGGILVCSGIFLVVTRRSQGKKRK